ncbi:MAG: 1-deoxy-D-xylulose-5-phosphate reductoisomerase [Gammaproteobacteria bacterium]|nr:MAG: 1-deoxy-D-xylulose-5-phosphate reductoisomerase [Gammaproteobacteria bacterium]
MGVVVLGSTGSIGASTLDVLARHPERYRVVALGARANVDRLAEQCLRHRPRYAALAEPAAAEALRRRLRAQAPEVEVLAGAEALEALAALPEAGCVMAAIVGAAGLRSTLAAARAGKRILLANKEALVMSGGLLLETARRHGARLLPVDSEHNAVFQCLPAAWEGGAGPPLERLGVRRLWLTASGGPFRDTPPEALAGVTPAQACAHPNWRMGRKISVDSATMMNKGLEVIEACRLFGLPPEAVRVLIHPQSVVHSLVEYVDGSFLAQLGTPDMRTPIAHALAWPERVAAGVEPLDLAALGRLDFREPDPERFPCLALAYEALARGGTATTALNAANEVAVAAFLEGRLPFTGIAEVVAATLRRRPVREARDLETVLAEDAEARRLARELVAGGARGEGRG